MPSIPLTLQPAARMRKFVRDRLRELVLSLNFGTIRFGGVCSKDDGIVALMRRTRELCSREDGVGTEFGEASQTMPDMRGSVCKTSGTAAVPP